MLYLDVGGEDPNAKSEKARFHFRILKGHGTADLIKAEMLNKNAYIGLILVGFALIALGVQDTFTVK